MQRNAEKVVPAPLPPVWALSRESTREVALTSPAIPLPTAVLPAEDLATAVAEARRVLEEQRVLAQTMLAAHDPKHWYVQLCQLTTAELLGICEEGRLPHPRWALRLLSVLHSQFLHNLRCWQHPSLGLAEPQWQSAFTALGLVGEVDSVYSVLTGLHLALRAQLEFDLPRAVAQALHGGLTSDCAEYRADLDGTALALRLATERLLTDTAAAHLPGWLPRPSAGLLGKTLEQLLRRYAYDMRDQCGSAFERGVQLARQARPIATAARQQRPDISPSKLALSASSELVRPVHGAVAARGLAPVLSLRGRGPLAKPLQVTV